VTGAERAIRWSTVAAVVGVAVVAGWVSYRHAYAVVRAHGESGPVAWLYPCTIDGMIYTASMALLDSARRRVRPPALARWLLACGIAATLAANVAAGVAFGLLGEVVAAWPALALVGSYELLMLIVRAGAAPAVAATVPAVAADADSAARAALATSIAQGSPLSQREIARRFGMPRSRAAVIAREVITSANGHG
jgi:hypothetical protein